MCLLCVCVCLCVCSRRGGGGFCLFLFFCFLLLPGLQCKKNVGKEGEIKRGGLVGVGETNMVAVRSSSFWADSKRWGLHSTAFTDVQGHEIFALKKKHFAIHKTFRAESPKGHELFVITKKFTRQCNFFLALFIISLSTSDPPKQPPNTHLYIHTHIRLPPITLLRTKKRGGCYLSSKHRRRPTFHPLIPPFVQKSVSRPLTSDQTTHSPDQRIHRHLYERSRR